MEKPRWTIEYFWSNTSSKIKFEFLNEPEISRLGEKGHDISIENKFIGGYGPISTIYKNSDEKFVGVPDIRVGTEKAFNSFWFLLRVLYLEFSFFCHNLSYL